MYVRYEHFFFFFFFFHFHFPFFFFFFFIFIFHFFFFFSAFNFQFPISIFQFSRPFPVSNFQFRFPFQFSFPFYNFNFPGVLALGLGENRTFCAIVSREFYWTSTAAMHIMPVSLSWRRSGAAAMAKPRDTLTVRLCFMDVNNCARFRPFQLEDLVGRVCKQLGGPVDDLLPASSRACVL